MNRWLRQRVRLHTRLRVPDASLPPHRVNCHSCGLRVALPLLKQGKIASCPRCSGVLARVESNPLMLPPALALSCLIVLYLVFSHLFMQVRLVHMDVYLTMPEMMRVLVLQEFGFLAKVMFILTFGAPLLFCLLCLYVYGSLLAQRSWPLLRGAARWLLRLREWMMLDVFFISTLVAYIKLGDVGQVNFGAAFWLMFVLSILLIRTVQSVPTHWLYAQIGRLKYGRYRPVLDESVNCSTCLFDRPAAENECAVCGSTLQVRQSHDLSLSLAFLLAAFVLYFPANLLEMMISSNPTVVERSTILSGIQFMWDDGDRLIAAIIFSASILVPILKIVALGILLYSVRFRPLMKPHHLAWLYHITERIGRWSMIDIFVIVMLMSTFQTHVARVVPGPAAVYFCLVVILTMLSAHFFDPRLIWTHRDKNS